MNSQFLVIVTAALATTGVWCKMFDRCELVRELSKAEYRIPRSDVATWVCIARHESEYNTSAVGHLSGNSGDHGIFQISDLYWCSPPGAGKACALSCDLLEDDDLTDDVTCALRIHRAHGRRSGDGFTAWAVYRHFCSRNVSQYVRGCDNFVSENLQENFRENSENVFTPKSSSLKYSTSPHFSTLKSTGMKINSLPKHGRKYASDINPTSQSVKKSTKHSFGDKSSEKPMPFLPTNKLFPGDGSTSETHTRSSETGFSQGSAARGADLDPKTEWLRIHYDPRFLDEST